MRLTLEKIKNSRIPNFLGYTPTDSRFLQILNEAQQRLMMQGLYWGTFQTYQICVSADGCLVWPRQVASIEALAVNNEPLTLRNGWFEYLQTGWGIRSVSNSSEMQLLDRGRTPVFVDMNDFVSTLEVYSEVAEDASARLLVTGYDASGNWIRTQDNGTWIDGEYIDISTSTASSANIYTAVTGIQKPVTNGPVHLSKVTGDGLTVPIGYYEWDETLPDYRKSLIPGLGEQPNYTCGSGDVLTNKRVVRAVVKLDHIDMVRDTDWAMIGNLPALKNACKSVQLAEQQNIAESQSYFSEAVRLLEVELEHYQGTTNVEPLKIEGETWGAGAIGNII